MTSFQGYIWLIVASCFTADRWGMAGGFGVALAAVLLYWIEGLAWQHAFCANCETWLPRRCSGEFSDERACRKEQVIKWVKR